MPKPATVSTSQAAEMLGLTVRAVQKMHTQGILSAEWEDTYTGRRRVFLRADILRLAKERRKNPPKPGPKPINGSP
jgi:DNA-binding transcriptional MerR regulator